jgi:hypothetical protein
MVKNNKNNIVYKYYNSQGWEFGSKKIMLDEEINVNNNSSCRAYNKLTRRRVLNELKNYKDKKSYLMLPQALCILRNFWNIQKSFLRDTVLILAK